MRPIGVLSTIIEAVHHYQYHHYHHFLFIYPLRPVLVVVLIVNSFFAIAISCG